MGLHHRKLIPEICNSICHCSSNKDCTVCFNICLTNLHNPFYDSPPPPPPPPPPPQLEFPFYNSNQNKHKITNYFFITLSLLALIFFLVSICAIYVNFRSRTRTRMLRLRTRAATPPPPSSSSSSSLSSRIQQIQVNFGDEQHHDSIVDHPIWYIRTLGLHQSVINAISVCKYKKGEGLIEGTECSVCLSEFEDDESLRLLPKCHHAFHLHCIDTWLSSHTNCPMCRAPIVNTNPTIARVESLESIAVDSHSTSLEHRHIDVFDGNSGESESNLGFENRVFDPELRNREEGEGGQLEVCENERRVVDEVSAVRPRRSVSMDDSFVAGINNVLVTVISKEPNGNEDSVSKVNGIENLATTSKGSSSFSFRSTRYLQGVPSPMRRSSSYNGNFLLSWYSRNQKKPNAILRSF